MGSPLNDFEADYSKNISEGGALSAPVAINPEDVQSRKDIFNQATQRILQQRQAMQQPYGGKDLSQQAWATNMLTQGGGGLGYGLGKSNMAAMMAEEAQRQAMNEYNQQQSGMDLQAQMAQILGQGGTLDDVSALAAIGGQDKIADNLGKLKYYSKTAKQNLPAALQLADEYEEARKSGDIQRMNDLETFAKTLEKNQKLSNTEGDVTLRGGAGDATSSMESSKKFGGTTGEEAAKNLSKMRDSATDAQMALETNKTARDLLDGGVITGTGADFITGFGNALSSRLGYSGADDPVENTQAFVSTMAGQVGSVIKQFGSGTGLSDADREYAKKIVGGDIALNEKSIRRIIDIRDRQNKWIINRYNLEYGKAPKSASPYDLSVDGGGEPPAKNNTSAPSKAPFTPEQARAEKARRAALKSSDLPRE